MINVLIFLIGKMLSRLLVTTIFIILHLSSCLATSDPHLYSNKSQQVEDDSWDKASLTLSDLVRGPNQVN